MSQELRSLQWVTPAKYVGPMMVIILVIAAALVATFVIKDRLNEAIITLLFAMCFLLLGVADLLGELIMLTGRSAQRPGA
jgi:uncharacterized membrane protein HdeD (DUF308 family)